MLRGLVLLFVLVNVALYFWIDSDPRWGPAEREPERVAHQVSPESIQVLADLPASAAASAGPAEPATAPSAAGSTP